MPGTPGTLSVGSPASAWTSTTLSGRDAELLEHLGRADRRFLSGSNIADAGADQLHQILVGGDDGDARRRCSQRELGIGGDQIVGLESRHLDAGTPKARVASRISANCGIRLVRRPGRWALYSG